MPGPAPCAKTTYDAAASICVAALERASDIPASGATWRGADGGTFDQRYATFGGDPAQLHFTGDGFDAAEAANDARAWQQAKQDPNDLANRQLEFGNDPTSSAFGGRTFDSDDGSTVAHAHSNYWNP